MGLFRVPDGQTLKRAQKSSDGAGFAVQSVPAIPIAPEGSCGWRCEAGHFQPFPSWDLSFNKRRCPAKTDDQECSSPLSKVVGIIPEAIELLSRPEKVRTSQWWHASTNPQFMAPPDGDPVHLGTKAAALSRAAGMNRVFNGTVAEQYTYLYELRLKPSAAICPSTYIEEPEDPCHSVMRQATDSSYVLRYVNFHEVPGGISLYAFKSSFDLVYQKRIHPTAPSF